MLLHPGASEPTSGPIPALALLVCLALFGAMLLAQGASASCGGCDQRGGGRHAGQDDAALRGLVGDLFTAGGRADCLDLLLYPAARAAGLADIRVCYQQRRTRAGWLLVGLIGYLIATLVFPLDPRTSTPMSVALCWVLRASRWAGAGLDRPRGLFLHTRRKGYAGSAADSVETNASGTMMPRATS